MSSKFVEIAGFATVIFGIILLSLLFSAVFSVIGGTIFYFLWNWLTPLVWAAAPTFSWLQAVGIWFLVGMIARLFLDERVMTSVR